MMADFIDTYSEFIILCVMLAAIIIVWLLGRRRNNRQFSASVKVKSKRTQRSVNRNLAGKTVAGIDWLDYYVTFITEKGKELELQCSEELFSFIGETDEGTLVYDRNYIISFDKR